MVMYIITSKLNSTLGTTGKATGVKMTANAVGKNFCVSVKSNLNMWSWSKRHVCKIFNIFLFLNIGFFVSA